MPNAVGETPKQVGLIRFGRRFVLGYNPSAATTTAPTDVRRREISECGRAPGDGRGSLPDRGPQKFWPEIAQMQSGGTFELLEGCFSAESASAIAAARAALIGDELVVNTGSIVQLEMTNLARSGQRKEIFPLMSRLIERGAPTRVRERTARGWMASTLGLRRSTGCAKDLKQKVSREPANGGIRGGST